MDLLHAQQPVMRCKSVCGKVDREASCGILNSHAFLRTHRQLTHSLVHATQDCIAELSREALLTLASIYTGEHERSVFLYRVSEPLPGERGQSSLTGLLWPLQCVAVIPVGVLSLGGWPSC